MSVWSVAHEDGVAVLTFTRPPSNWMDTRSLRELAHRLEAVADEEHVRVVMLTGGLDGYFVAHADVDELAQLEPDGSGPDLSAWGKATRLLERIPQPTVAAIDGQAWGGGLEIALAASLRIASERSHVGLPEVTLGIIPGSGGTQRLPRVIGAGRAAEMIFGGRVIKAAEAAELGLLNAVLPDDGFRDAAVGWCRRIARHPAAALFAAKRAIFDGLEGSIEAGLQLETDLFGALAVSEEARSRNAALHRPG